MRLAAIMVVVVLVLVLLAGGELCFLSARRDPERGAGTGSMLIGVVLQFLAAALVVVAGLTWNATP